MSLADWVVAFSITLQFTAAYFAVRMIAVTGRKRAWLFIAAAVTLMGVRRLVSLVASLADPSARPLDLQAESIALVISVCMVVGLYYLKPLFVEARLTAQRADTLQAHMAALSSLMWDGVVQFHFNCSDEGVVSDCTIIDANQAFDRLSGVAHSRRRTRTLVDALNLGSRDEAMLYKRLAELCASGERQMSGIVIPSRGRWLDCSFFLLEDQVCIALLRDITAEREHADSLKQQVKERTEELERANTELARTNTQLERTNSELAASSEVKARFLAATSHELRTPLNSIIGFTGVLLSGAAGELTEEQNHQLSMVQISGKNLLRLVNNLLDLSRIDAGAVTIECVEGNLEEACRETLDLVRPGAERKDIELHFVGSGQGCDTCRSTIFDREKVQQVLLNLVGNAVRHTEGGKVTVELSCDDDMRYIRVSDTGIGIPQELQEHVFGEFEQATRSGPAEGSGLGLPISQRLARLMGGEVVLERSTEAGTTFILTLPRECPPPPE